MSRLWNVLRIALLLSLALVLALCGCAEAPAPAAAEDAPVADAAEAAAEETAEPADDAAAEIETGGLRGKVLTDSGDMLPAGIIVFDEAGNSARYLTNLLGAYNIKLLPGNYTLRFTRGPEYDTVDKAVTVESYKTLYLQDVRLVQLFNMFERGYAAGDLHQHSYYSDGMDSVDTVALSNISVGLDFAFLSDHNTARGLAEWMQVNRLAADIDPDGTVRTFAAFDAVEVTTEFGHYQSLGVGMTFDLYEVQLRDIERSLPAADRDAVISERVAYIADTIRWSGGVPQINHPYSSGTMGFNSWDVADHFDTIEIWNGVFNPGDGRFEPEKSSEQTQNYRSKLKWYELLNEVKNGGKFFAATGGTDNHTVASAYAAGYDLSKIVTKEDYTELYQSSGRYSGVPTTYVRVNGDTSLDAVLSSLRNGHSFLSNGILVTADIAGASYGDTVALGAETPVMALTAFCRDGMEEIRLVKNGEPYQSIACDGSTREYTLSLPLEGLTGGDWITVEVTGPGAYYAITNPIFFQ